MLSVTLFLLAHSVAVAAPRTLKEVKTAGVIRLATDSNAPPFSSRRQIKDKEPTGFEIDLGREIARRLGVGVRWVEKSFSALLPTLDRGEAELVISGHAVTPARSAVADFTDALYCADVVIVSREDGPRTVAELKGKSVVAPVGTVYVERLKAVEGLEHLRTVPNETDGLQSLLKNRVDAWITEDTVAQDAVAKHAAAGLRIGEHILPQRNALVVAKGNTELRDAVNRILRELLNDGTYGRLSMQYFKRDVRCGAVGAP